MIDYRILDCGDSAVSVEFGNEITPEANAFVHSLAARLEKYRGKWLVEAVPSFRSLLVVFDPIKVKRCRVKDAVSNICASLSDGGAERSGKRTVLIPVCYGGEFGEDIDDVAALNSISVDEVISIHSGTDYLIYMLGFLPGFPYLGGLDKRIETPRLESPRTRIDAGSVGIGGSQTGIYPLASPGGWRLIGRTPVKPYDSARTPTVLYEAGDYIRFVPIDREEYDRIEALVQKGEYECQTEIK
jgi:KipI family sensor histidine kinase inhibitor